VLFLATTALLVPVEQFVAREVDAGRRALGRGATAPLTVLAAAIVLPAVLVGATLERAFDGRAIYIAITAVMMLGMASALVARGVHTGRRRFDRYARSIVVEGSARLVLGAAGFAVIGGAIGMSWGLALGGFLALVGPVGLATARGERTQRRHGAAFLGPYVIATSASQTLIAAAPLVVAGLGARPAVVSIVFVTFTTLRTPATLLIALQSRVLSALLRLRAAGDDARVTWLALRTAAIGALAAGPVGVLGALGGPALLAALFGPDFRPSGALAGLTAAGVTIAMANQLVGQASVARGRTRVLALSWTAGLAVAALVLLALAPLVAPLVAPQVEVRVALAFLAGEIVTLGALAAGTRAAGGRPSTLA
jgi:O-antigen/teichoic acid export membrane protein